MLRTMGFMTGLLAATLSPLAAHAEWQAVAVGLGDGISTAGYSGTTYSKGAARSIAVKECKEWGGINCEVVHTYNKGCYWFVKGDAPDGSENYAHGKSLRRAIEECSMGGDYDCTVKKAGGCVGR